MEMGFPFTNAQWKELERQSVIYKYMVARIPVPVHLLSPFSTSSPAPPVDMEAGRCRRTDGKKWRCSRDVAPNQKYCERHINRGRPRSRKHVEQQQQLKQHSSTISTTTTSCIASSANHKKPRHHQQTSLFPSPSPPSPSFYPHLQPRNMEWMMRTEQEEQQQWLQLINPSHSHSQHEDHQTYLNLATDNNTPPLFLNFDPNPTHHHSDQISRSFIDAWSQTTTAVNDHDLNDVGDLSPSSLTLGMGMGNGWVNSSSSSSCSWVSPLAEVLRPPATGFGGGGSDDVPADSPSGVLQKTAMASLSDSSNCSSPTKTKPEFALF